MVQTKKFSTWVIVNTFAFACLALSIEYRGLTWIGLMGIGWCSHYLHSEGGFFQQKIGKIELIVVILFLSLIIASIIYTTNTDKEVEIHILREFAKPWIFIPFVTTFYIISVVRVYKRWKNGELFHAKET
jgi:hypothetical protein